MNAYVASGGLILGSVPPIPLWSWFCRSVYLPLSWEFHLPSWLPGCEKYWRCITGTYRCGHGSRKCTCRCLVFEVFPQRCRRLVLGSLCSVWFGSVPAVAAMVEGSLCTYHGLRSPTYLRGRRFLGSVCVVLEIISAVAARLVLGRVCSVWSPGSWKWTCSSLRSSFLDVQLLKNWKCYLPSRPPGG